MGLGARVAAVAARRRDPARPEPSSGTLGGLLYADRTTVPVCEAEWVALVRSIAAGDQTAMRALYDACARIVFTLIVRITNNRETAEEVTLDVFHDVWRRAPRYDAAGGTVVGWIMNQARSRAIDRLRFEQRKKRASEPVDAGTTVVRGPQDDFDVREQAHILRRALTALNDQERQAIEIAYFSGFTYAEVADRLEEPLGTVKTRIRSGLEKLRQRLGRGGGEP